MTKSYAPILVARQNQYLGAQLQYMIFIRRKFHLIRPCSCGVRSRNSKLQIVLKFLIFEKVVRPQFWSHDKTNIQVHNFNIYSFIVESSIRLCPVVLEFRSRNRNPPEKLTDRQTDGQTDGPGSNSPSLSRYAAGGGIIRVYLPSLDFESLLIKGITYF